MYICILEHEKHFLFVENKITKINGVQLYNCFTAGAQKIFENQALLNKINFFPVADADTGSNLASTMLSIVNMAQPQDNLGCTAVSLADAALMGARGNSGIIFAQFLYGFSQNIKDEVYMTVNSFAESIQNAAKCAYDSIVNPKEGTMISVIKDWADSIYKLKNFFDDFNKILLDALNIAWMSLKSTGRWIVTKAKNIVDAGAKGFVVFLEGMCDYFQSGEKTVELTNTKIVDVGWLDTIDHQTITFRYCTEALLIGEDLNRDCILNIINILGDSIVIAGSSNKMRLHIHTDRPWIVLERVQTLGRVIYQKVEDMIMQNDLVSNRKSKTCILTDSTCDIPKNLLEKYQIQTVPLSIHFGDEYYLDHLTIKPKQFIDKLIKSKELPTSAQPSFIDFTNRYNYLTTHYDSIISTHISGGLSGTFNGSRKAAEKVSETTGKNIHVIDSKNTTAGLGLLVMRIAENAKNGMEYKELISKTEKWIEKLNMYIACKTTKYMISGGRLNSFKSFIIKYIGIKPLISLNKNGKLRLVNISLSNKHNINNIIRSLKDNIGNKNIWNYTVTHVDNIEAAKYLQGEMKKITGKDALYIADASPMLAGKVGPGTVAVAVMEE